MNDRPMMMSDLQRCAVRTVFDLFPMKIDADCDHIAWTTVSIDRGAMTFNLCKSHASQAMQLFTAKHAELRAKR